MRSKSIGFLAATGLLLAFLFLMPLRAQAGVHVNIGINVAPPPAYVIHKPPMVAVVPGTYVYFIPGIRVDILFYHGYWYRPYRGRWYSARYYNGPWHHVVTRRVPYAVLHLPPHYRHERHAYRYIPYARMERNWAAWERERYWDRHEERRHYRERRREDRRDRRWDHNHHDDYGHEGENEGY